jgi:hypothetical protein
MPHKIPGIEIPDSVYRIPKNYSGLIIVSDIDRTYLNTEIHSIGGLLKTAFERPERKSNVPGFSLLLRALRRGATDDPQKSPLFFLSASLADLTRKEQASYEAPPPTKADVPAIPAYNAVEPPIARL